MFWFGKRKKNKEVMAAAAKQATIEIVASKQAGKEVVDKARATNKQLNDLLVENGFTVKIYLAAGGTSHKEK